MDSPKSRLSDFRRDWGLSPLFAKAISSTLRIGGELLPVPNYFKQVTPETKVVIFTAMDEPFLRQQSLEVGASAFVCKVGDTDLLATINQLFAGNK